MQNLNTLSIGRGVDMYLSNRISYYNDGRGPTREYDNLKSGLSRLVDAIGSERISSINAPMIARVRDQWIAEGKVSAAYINKRLQYVGRFVKWLVEQGLLESNRGIPDIERTRAGRHGLKASAPILPAPKAAVDAVYQAIPPQFQAMIQIMQLTGMRPGEARLMQLVDLEAILANGKQAYRYTPKRHKSAHLGKRRRIFLVGKSYQLTVERISSLARSTLFDPDSQGYLFSPDESGDLPFAKDAVHQRIRRTCDKLGVERWSPNQLRHGFATESRAKGIQLDLIADLLGHSDPRTTLIYAEPDDTAALDATIQLAI